MIPSTVKTRGWLRPQALHLGQVGVFDVFMNTGERQRALWILKESVSFTIPEGESHQLRAPHSAPEPWHNTLHPLNAAACLVLTPSPGGKRVPSVPFLDKPFEKGQEAERLVLMSGHQWPAPAVPWPPIATISVITLPCTGQSRKGMHRDSAMGKLPAPPRCWGRARGLCLLVFLPRGFGAPRGPTLLQPPLPRARTASPAEFAECISQIQMKNAALKALSPLSGICLTPAGQTQLPSSVALSKVTQGSHSRMPVASSQSPIAQDCVLQTDQLLAQESRRVEQGGEARPKPNCK